MRERGLAISKRKTLETAQKYVQKGAFDKALKEYLKHHKVEPDDTNARLKMGDVHLKRGDPAAAIEAYSQVASLLRTGIQRNVGYELSGSFGVDLPYVKPVSFENSGTIRIAGGF